MIIKYLFNGIFRFYSYRDPNLVKTFEAFEKALEWVQSTALKFDPLEEAILGLISSMDAPGSPAGDARKTFHNELLGRDLASFKEKRERILAVTVDDVKRVATKYFDGPNARAVVCSENASGDLDSSYLVKAI